MTQYSDGLDDNLTVGLAGSCQPIYCGSSSDGVYVVAAGAFKWTAGASISDLIKLRDIALPGFIYRVTINDLIKMAQVQNWVIPVAVTQGLTLHDAAIAAIGAYIADRLKLASTLSAQTQYHIALAEALAVYDTFAHFFGVGLAEGVQLGSSAAGSYRAIASLLDGIYIRGWNYDLSHIVFSVQYDETVDFDDSQLLRMIYSGQIAEQIQVRVLYVSPSGNVTTWAINTRTNAVTQYENWKFNSFATVGRKYIAAGPGGLYELDGERDIVTGIPTRVAGGLMQMNGGKFSGLKGVYLGMDAHGGDFFLKLEAGDGREWVYRFQANPNLMTTKVNIGKGLRARYLGWELITEGQDYDFESIEFVPMMFDRRV